MIKKISFIKIFIIFLFSFLIFSCKENNDKFSYTLSWENNNISYGLSKDEASPGEPLFLNFKADLNPSVKYEMITARGEPLSQKVWKNYFTNLEKSESRIEIIWYEDGEFLIDDLAIKFIKKTNNQSVIFPLEMMAVTIKSQLNLPKNENESIEEVATQLIPKINNLDNFVLNNPKIIISIIIQSLIYLFTLTGVLIFLILKRNKKNSDEVFIEKSKKIFSKFKKNPNNPELIISLYNIYYTSFSLLNKTERINLRNQYESIIEDLEPKLFSNKSNKEKTIQSITINKFINLYEKFLDEVEQIIKNNKLKKKKRGK